MKIGISTSVIQRGKTGIAQYVFALLRAYKHYASEHEFVLFVLEDDLPLFDFTKDAMRIVPVPEKFRSPTKNILWHQKHLPDLARRLHLDVLHVPSYRRLLWPKPCPLVATIHDLAPFHVAEKYDWVRMFYGRVIVKRLAARQDEIIAISENTARDIYQFFNVPIEKVSIIHNGLDHERFFPAPKDAAKRVIAERHRIEGPFFLYIARLEHPAKNHLRLIQAFEAFKAETKSNWKLIFGGSDWHGAEAIHAGIQNSPYKSDIRCLGFVSSNDLPTLYRAADAFVCPSLYEGFGLPPIEAMACGCPVISSTRGSLWEVVGNAAAVIDPEDIASIKKELTSFAWDTSRRESFAREGIIHARRFDWEKTAEETLKIYAKAAGVRWTPRSVSTQPQNVIPLPGKGESQPVVAHKSANA